MGFETPYSEQLEAFVQSDDVKAAVGKKQFAIDGDTVVFGVYRFIIAIGLVSVLIAAGAAFIPDITGKIIMIALFGLLGIPLLLYGLFARLYVDAEKIVYRNPVGIEKQIYWRDITSVYTASMQGDVRVCSDNTYIVVYSHL